MATVDETTKQIGDLTKLPEGGTVDLGPAGQYTKSPDGSYAPVVLSTVQGADMVNQGKQTLEFLSGSQNPGSAIKYDPKNPYNLDPSGKPMAGTGNFTAGAMPGQGTNGTTQNPNGTGEGFVTYINPATGQTQKLGVSSLTPDAVRSLSQQGYSVAESEGSVPSWVVNNNPDMGEAQVKLDAATKDFDSLKQQLSQFVISDQAVQSQVNGITAQWDSRIADMQRINDAREAAIRTTGIRYGSQYSGGSGGVFGGIVAEEERQGVQRIADLEAQKQAAIAAARDGARTKNWEVYSKQVDYAEKSYDQQLEAVKELNKIAMEQNQKIREKAQQASRDSAIAGLVGQGVVDPGEILSTLNKNGGTFTLDEISQSLKSLLPAGFDDIAKTAAANGASPDVIRSILGAKSAGDAYAAAGSYLQNGSGIVGEYQFYKRQAEAAGQAPVDFNTYQDMDANRKKAIAKAGSASGLDSSTLTKVQGIAGQFDSEQTVKNYQTVAEGKAFLDSIPDDTKNPADQQGAIYAFAKIMDPNSVVREGEYNTVQKYAQSWASTFGFDAARIFSNSPFLTADALKNMKATIASKVTATENSYKNIYNEYGRRINKITGAKDGTDYITDYSKGYGATGSQIIDTEQQAEAKVQNIYPQYQKQIDDLLSTTPGMSNADLLQVLGL